MAEADQPSAGTATRSDEEVLALAKEHVGAHFGLSAAQSARLRGSTKSELEADARQMRSELGLEPLDDGDGRVRDEHGRFVAGGGGGSMMNELIRRAAGRTA